jgi:hypothetical protein
MTTYTNEPVNLTTYSDENMMSRLITLATELYENIITESGDEIILDQTTQTNWVNETTT